MLDQFWKFLRGAPGASDLRRVQPVVTRINALEDETHRRSDSDLRALTAQFRERLAGALERERAALRDLQTVLDHELDEDERRVLKRQLAEAKRELDRHERQLLDTILPEAFAAVREAAVRAIGLRHFDEQLLGGIVLHQGKIAEMKTGEGKTLVATLPLYLSALTGRGAHLVTPNDYLSKIGVQWMGPVYALLGLSVGVVQSMGADPKLSSFLFDPDYTSEDDRYQHLRPCTRAEAYAADITYGTNNEFGFDYLRDNMAMYLHEIVQREPYYAIVDEADNILIDEARTPLIISGQAEAPSNEYQHFDRIVRTLTPGQDYVVEEKERSVSPTDSGYDKVQRALKVEDFHADERAQEWDAFLRNALKAHALFRLDRDYIVSEEHEVIIVDEFTGRLMYGRRYSDGLHEAIEAKEGVRVQRENLTMATITFQNYFRMYRRLAGMTGTAVTEAEEFSQVYNMGVVAIPTHKDMIRLDHPDVIYRSAEAKFRAVVQEIQACHERGQPVLVGTLAVETSEMLAQKLTKLGVPHQVLNAKQHEKEAQVITQAGRAGAVTIATNMAGRGVDILLGGNPDGLAREALRRKGYDLTRLEPQVWQDALEQARADCAQDRERVVAAGGLHVLGTERHEARRIDNQLRGRSGRQGDPGSSRFYVALDDDLMRRFSGEAVARIMGRLGMEEDMPIAHTMVSRLLESTQVRVEGYNFDLRKHLLEYDSVLSQQRELIYDQRRMVLADADSKALVLGFLQDELLGLIERYYDREDDAQWDTHLHQAVNRLTGMPPTVSSSTWKNTPQEQLTQEIMAQAEAIYAEREQSMGAEEMRRLERTVLLSVIDQHWMHYLTSMDLLRWGINLQAIAQRNPLVEYKRAAYTAFEDLKGSIQQDVAGTILKVRLPPKRTLPVDYAGASGGSAGSMRPARHSKVGRNELCPCGSGRKYKNCCGMAGLSRAEAAAKGAKAGAPSAASGAPVRRAPSRPAGAAVPGRRGARK